MIGKQQRIINGQITGWYYWKILSENPGTNPEIKERALLSQGTNEPPSQTSFQINQFIIVRRVVVYFQFSFSSLGPNVSNATLCQSFELILKR